MNFNEMTIEEIEARKAEILTELDAPEADLDALKKGNCQLWKKSETAKNTLTLMQNM